MNPTRIIVAVLVFAFSLGITVISRRPPSPTPARTSTTRTAPAHHTKAIRAENPHTEVRAMLREGRMDDAHELLRQLASRDPVAFFKLLEKLPGLPGMESLIHDAAAQLPWADPKITKLLNNISNNDLRDLAWIAYITPRAGVLPDEEVFHIGTKAVSSFALKPLYADAAAKRPDAFLDFLNTINKANLRVGFFEELMKVHPERMSELYHRIPDAAPGAVYDKAYIMQMRLCVQPTAENLRSVLMDRGSKSVYDVSISSSLVRTAYSHAGTPERAEMLSWIESLPPLARNRMLDGVSFSSQRQHSDPVSSEELSRFLNLYTSAPRQEAALKSWLIRNPGWDQKNPDWIEKLPNERLRQHVLELIEKQGTKQDR